MVTGPLILEPMNTVADEYDAARHDETACGNSSPIEDKASRCVLCRAGGAEIIISDDVDLQPPFWSLELTCAEAFGVIVNGGSNDA